MCMASSTEAPAAISVPSVAMTVSPAPETSYTSRARAGIEWAPASEKRLIPCSERVTSNASTPSSERSHCALRVSSCSSSQRPITWRSSPRFGVSSCAPRYLAQSSPFGPMRTRALDHRRYVREPAFAIVRHHHDVDFVQQPLVIRELRREQLVRRRLLEIDPQQLLASREHAKLDGCRERSIAQERRRHAIG